MSAVIRRNPPTMPACNLGKDWTAEYEYWCAQYDKNWDAAYQQALDQRLDQADRTQQEQIMPNINQMMPSKYLKKEDVPLPALVTIRDFTHENVAQQGQPEEKKWIMHFEEFENGMVMNSTNLQLAAQALGSDETEDWIGRKIVIFNDPNVSFGGKLTGGIRLRAQRVRQAAPVAARPQFTQPRRPAPPPIDEPPPFDDIPDDLPF